MKRAGCAANALEVTGKFTGLPRTHQLPATDSTFAQTNSQALPECSCTHFVEIKKWKNFLIKVNLYKFAATYPQRRVGTQQSSPI